MRVGEGGDDACFALESFDAIEIARERRRQHLECDVAAEPGVERAIDLAHPAFTQLGEDAVVTEDGSVGERHGRDLINGPQNTAHGQPRRMAFNMPRAFNMEGMEKSNSL